MNEAWIKDTLPYFAVPVEDWGLCPGSLDLCWLVLGCDQSLWGRASEQGGAWPADGHSSPASLQEGAIAQEQRPTRPDKSLLVHLLLDCKPLEMCGQDGQVRRDKMSHTEHSPMTTPHNCQENK